MSSTKQRYFIAVTVPELVAQALRAWFVSTYGRALSVRHLHCTIVPPFYLRSDQDKAASTRPEFHELLSKLSELTITPFTAHTERLGMFEQHDSHILHFALAPLPPFLNLHRTTLAQVKPYITFDTAVYDEGKVPVFEPHLTTDYNAAPEDVRELSTQFSFSVERLTLLVEKSPRVWEVVTTR